MMRAAGWMGLLLVILAAGFFGFARGHHAAVVAEGTDWLPWLGLLFDVLGKLDWLNAVFIAALALSAVLLVVAQFTAGDGFDLRALLGTRVMRADGTEFWTVTARAYQFGGFLVTSWGFVKLIDKSGLSDLYLFIYAAAWLASPAINQIVANKFPVTAGALIPDAPLDQTITTSKTETQTKSVSTT